MNAGDQQVHVAAARDDAKVRRPGATKFPVLSQGGINSAAIWPTRWVGRLHVPPPIPHRLPVLGHHRIECVGRGDLVYGESTRMHMHRCILRLFPQLGRLLGPCSYRFNRLGLAEVQSVTVQSTRNVRWEMPQEVSRVVLLAPCGPVCPMMACQSDS